MARFFCLSVRFRPQLEYHSYHFKSNYLPGLRVLVSEGVPLGLLNLFGLPILDYPPLVLTAHVRSEGKSEIFRL